MPLGALRKGRSITISKPIEIQPKLATPVTPRSTLSTLLASPTSIVKEPIKKTPSPTMANAKGQEGCLT